jgi:hypothetical protein
MGNGIPHGLRSVMNADLYAQAHSPDVLELLAQFHPELADATQNPKALEILFPEFLFDEIRQ